MVDDWSDPWPFLSYFSALDREW